MRVTGRWTTDTGKTGRMPGKFATATDAETAARKFMTRHPTVAMISVSHDTGGWMTDVTRDGKSSHGWRATA